MECKFCDDFNGICTNPESPMCGDECPVPDFDGVCRYEERIEVVYKLTPKGCAIAALEKAGLANDPRVDTFWESFEKLMIKFGYVEGADGREET